MGIAGGACCVGSQDADVRRELLVSVGIEDHVRASLTIPATVQNVVGPAAALGALLPAAAPTRIWALSSSATLTMVFTN